jgi:SAM-dependent methyltransferase
MRDLVGGGPPESFDQPRRQPVFPGLTRHHYDLVLDFGCGCGRFARRLALAARPTPKRYIGVDLHAGMIRWAQENLSPRLPGFEFIHQDVYNAGFNPDPALPRTAPFPVEDQTVTLLLAMSVFTHLTQDQAEFYLDEVARVLAPKGLMVSSFFMFEKRYFPMMQEFQNALYINTDDPTNAVIYDREWLLAALAARGLAVRSVRPPLTRGFHWQIRIGRGGQSVPVMPDRAPFGKTPPPVISTLPHLIGSDEPDRPAPEDAETRGRPTG